MNTELQTESVYIIGQSLESDTVGSRREAVECRRIAAVLIVYTKVGQDGRVEIIYR